MSDDESDGATAPGNAPGPSPVPVDSTGNPPEPHAGAPAPPHEPPAPRPGAVDVGRPRDAAPGAMVELNALLGHGTHYVGKLFFEGRIRIEGKFEGEVRGGILVIGSGADLEGDIEVEVCIVTGGRVRAEIRAHDAIELHAPSIVVGDLHAPNVFIDRGVQFQGNCRMAPLDDSPPVARPAEAPPAKPVEDMRGELITLDGIGDTSPPPPIEDAPTSSVDQDDG